MIKNDLYTKNDNEVIDEVELRYLEEDKPFRDILMMEGYVR